MAPNGSVAWNSASRAERRQDIAGTFAHALDCHRRGLLADAQKGYRRILKKHPDQFDTLHMLGVSEKQLGNYEAAMRLIKRALLANPLIASVHSNLASLLMELKRFKEAIASCDKAIELDPRLVDAHYNRGNALVELKQFVSAVESFRKALAIDPMHANAYNNCGNALCKSMQFIEAKGCYDQAIALNPDYASAYVNRAAAWIGLRKTDEAIQDLDRALAVDPGNVDAWINRGEFLLRTRFSEALASFDHALQLDPKSEIARLGRANGLMLLRRLTEAKSACEEALAINPTSVKGLVQLSQCHASRAETDLAIDCLDRALALDPDDEIAITNRIFWLDFSNKADVACQQAARADWWRAIGSKEIQCPQSARARDLSPDRKLVVGYVSAEFKRRSAAFSYRPVFENHDKSQFEIICYSNSPNCDDVTDTFRQFADRWRDVSQSFDDELVDCIQRDGVDILVDLSGYGEGHRLRVFARKPAPIQVTAWGHANGTGLPTIDYLFSDLIAIPSDVRGHYAEQIHDLPCLIALEPPNNVARSEVPPVVKNGYLTYGVFNRVSKCSAESIALWSRLLTEDPACRLIIKDHMLDDSETCGRLLDRFKADAVDPGRISLLGTTDRDIHLAAISEVDICLDPFPHGGGVSTWEALYMGVPVVTKLGHGLAGRMSAAILHSIGLTGWAAADDSEYLDIAKRPTPAQLETLRRDLPSLIDRRCGPVSYTRAVEVAYREMWRRYCDA